MKLLTAALLTLGILAPYRPAHAWGRVGHETVVAIARTHLKPAVRAKVDALLAGDPDTLTAPDMVSRSVWADAWRAGHPETTNWHFVNIEIDHPDLTDACYGFPSGRGLASAGPADDCVVNKIEAFERELKDPRTPTAEKRLALKYLLHFVGDLHQPLHSSDNHDRGGNCVRLSLGGPRTTNLHAWWDSGLIEGITTDPGALARRLERDIKPLDRLRWSSTGPRDWAMETFTLSRTNVYTLASKPGCDSEAAPVPVPAGYNARGLRIIELQLKRAGVRLAAVLNRALA